MAIIASSPRLDYLWHPGFFARAAGRQRWAREKPLRYLVSAEYAAKLSIFKCKCRRWISCDRKKNSICHSVDSVHADRREPHPPPTPGLGVLAAKHDVPSGLCCLCQSHNSSNVHAVLNLVGLISDDDTQA